MEHQWLRFTDGYPLYSNTRYNRIFVTSFSIKLMYINLFVGTCSNFSNNVPRSKRILYTHGIHTHTYTDRVWITIQGFTSCHESSWLSFWNFWHLPVTEKGEAEIERSERQRERERVAGVGARGKSSGYSFELQMAGTILCAPVRPDEAFPRNAAGTWQFFPPSCACLCVCVRLYSPLFPPTL